MIAGSTQLMPDCGGTIEEIAISLASDFFGSEFAERRALYGRMCEILSAQAQLTILCEETVAGDVRKWLACVRTIRPPKVAAVAPRNGLFDGGYWIRDPFLCTVANPTRTYLITGMDPDNNEGTWLGASDGTLAKPVDMMLPGGNCLVGDDFWLIGVEAITHTANSFIPRYGKDPEKARQAIAALDGRRLYVIGTVPQTISQGLSMFSDTVRQRVSAPGGYRPRPHTAGRETARGKMWRYVVEAVKLAASPVRQYQPIYHLDLFMSVTGLRVGSMPVLVVADALRGSDPDGPQHPTLGPNIDSVVKQLSSDFLIVRNPMPSAIVSGATTPRFYNNVLVQNNPNIVWLPQFGDKEDELKAADKRNCEVWEKLGFKVIRMCGWTNFAFVGAALHCATKVLARAPVRQSHPITPPQSAEAKAASADCVPA